MRRARSAGLLLGVVLAFACSGDTPVQPVTPPSDTNRPPTAALTVSGIGQEGASVGFSAAGSRDPDGDSLYYTWDWGDGTTITGTYPVQTHEYLDNGSYTVVLTVTDTHGAKATATAQVFISNATPYITSIELATPPLPASVPMTATIRATYSDPGPADNPVLSINWGDGTISKDTIHSYTVPGIYSLSVTVTDKDGAAVTNAIRDRVWVYDPSQNQGNPPGFDVIDLGNLGGNRAMPAALNNLGEVVGSSMTADNQRHAFSWKDGVMKDIGLSLDGSSTAQTINDVGWIGGALTRDELLDNSLVVWRNGSVTISRTGSDENYASAVAVDDAGQVLVKIALHENGISALWRNGELIRLAGFIPGLDYATAWDMNSRGQIVGTSAFQSTGPQRYAWRAVLWEDGEMKDLGDPGRPCIGETDPYDCGHSTALSINDNGQIVGAAGAPGAVVRAVIWEAGSRTPTDLGFGSGRSRAVSINGRGQIAGDSHDAREGFYRDPFGPGEGYFRDADGSVVNLGSLGGGGTQVKAMNEDGFVIGTSKTAIGEIHAFIWRRSTGMIDLGVGPYGARGVGAFPVAISDRGDVTGYVVPCFNAPYGLECHTWSGPSRAILWRAKSAAVVRR